MSDDGRIVVSDEMVERAARELWAQQSTGSRLEWEMPENPWPPAMRRWARAALEAALS